MNLDNAVPRWWAWADRSPCWQVTLPVGISFFTFMAISYVVDIYRRELEPARALDFAVYLSFFPHLVAGPIVRGDRAAAPDPAPAGPELHVDYVEACWLIAAGLFKKVVHLVLPRRPTIVDAGVHRRRASTRRLEVLFAIYGYAVQIYADFSGYTDIAIGLALLLGFRFPQNFDAPYTARSTCRTSGGAGTSPCRAGCATTSTSRWAATAGSERADRRATS